MKFTDDMKSSVYKVQCQTYSVMKELHSLTSDVSRGPDPRHLFRVVVGRRSPESLALRKKVADEVRRRRAS
jgi:hypothetical protein